MTGVRARKSRRSRRPNTTRPGKKRKLNKKPVITDATVRKHWDKTKTLKENFKELGLAYNPNEAVQPKQEERKMEIETGIVSELQKEASNEKKTERFISSGEADFLTAMLNDHGEDYKAMSKDKRNIYQHTPKQLKRKCEAYMKSPYFEKYQQKMEIDE